MLDVKQLRVLKEVAEQGSFSAAAAALSYSQPAISQQIAALERHAGAKLVDRTSRGVRLTDAGRALVSHTEVILARLADAEEELEAIRELRGGQVRLASFPTGGASLIPVATAAFRRRHPGVEVSLSVAGMPSALERLQAGEVDVARLSGRGLRAAGGVRKRRLLGDSGLHRGRRGRRADSATGAPGSARRRRRVFPRGACAASARRRRHACRWLAVAGGRREALAPPRSK